MTTEPILTNELPYLLPYDWTATLNYFRAHALPHLEMVDGSGNRESFKCAKVWVGTECGAPSGSPCPFWCRFGKAVRKTSPSFRPTFAECS